MSMQSPALLINTETSIGFWRLLILISEYINVDSALINRRCLFTKPGLTGQDIES